ncbi:MAG: hypothetical protein IPI67_17275 [Myxococcales bacterium]|nr:hypothetical protein [Myxococcales bacterium]
MKERLVRRIAHGLALVASFSLAVACGSDDSSGGGGGGSVASGGGGVSSGGVSSGGVGSGGVNSGGGSAGIASGGVAGQGLDAGTDAPINYGPYPAGPYGNNVGDTIANLAWEGYLNVAAQVSSDTLPYVDYSTDEMRKSGKPFGLIHISAFT